MDRKVKGTIHWVNAATAFHGKVRLYESLIEEGKEVYDEATGQMNLNPDSLKDIEDCVMEPCLKDANAYDSFQFVRNGFFCADNKDSVPGAPVFNRVVGLKSSFKLPTA